MVCRAISNQQNGTIVISERRLASGFHGFWDELLPLLTPTFVRLFNEAYRKPLNEVRGISTTAVPLGQETIRNDFVAEAAFHLARVSYQEKLELLAIINDVNLRQNIVAATTKLIDDYEGDKTSESAPLSQPEWQEAQALAKNYEIFLHLFDNNVPIEFIPIIRGAGFLGSCQADLSIGQTLYEVKTVNRNIASKDIRQLILYLALQAATGDRRWKNAGLFNPRRAVYYEFGIDHFIFHTSGGRSTTEVFQDIVDFLSSRDTQLDTAF